MTSSKKYDIIRLFSSIFSQLYYYILQGSEYLLKPALKAVCSQLSFIITIPDLFINPVPNHSSPTILPLPKLPFLSCPYYSATAILPLPKLPFLSCPYYSATTILPLPKLPFLSCPYYSATTILLLTFGPGPYQKLTI
jgi:hypothetical protein